VRTRRPVG
jgi:hypothetical protein